MPDKLCTIDFETYPDLDVLKNIVGPEGLEGPDPLKAYLVKEHSLEEDAERYFPPQVFHKIVVVSMLQASIVKDPSGIETHYVVDFITSSNDREEVMVDKLLSHINKDNKRLVTYNGRTFELPLLRLRAMRHGIPYGLDFAGTKWDNYDSRYSHGYHADVADILSRYGASKMTRLGEVAALLNLPGKILAVGHDVKGLYDKGDYETIKQYCELDSLLTYIIYLINQYTSRIITLQGFHESRRSLIAYLQAYNKSHTNTFLEHWKRMQDLSL